MKYPSPHNGFIRNGYEIRCVCFSTLINADESENESNYNASAGMSPTRDESKQHFPTPTCITSNVHRRPHNQYDVFQYPVMLMDT